MAVTGLDEFYAYKNQLAKDLLNNENILKLLSPTGVPAERPKELMYAQVFPYEYMPDTVETANTYIFCDVDVSKSMDKTYLKPVLYIWILVHKSLLRLPGGAGVRTDAVAAEIVRAINGSRKYGLGELDFYSAKRFSPITDYQGKVLTFNAEEFNRLSPTRQPVPSNRRRR